MGIGDIGEAIARLTQAAEAQGPVEFEDDVARGKLKTHGISLLEAAMDGAAKAQDVSETVAAFAKLMEGDNLGALAMAWRLAEGEVSAALMKLRVDKRLGTPCNKLESAIRRAAKLQEENEKRIVHSRRDNKRRDLRKLFDQAFIPTGLSLPHGWDVDREGVWSVRVTSEGEEKRTKVASAPILLVGRARDVHTGEVQLKVAWRYGAVWHTRTIDRAIVMDARKLVTLSSTDAPVHTGNAAPLVQYLADFESENSDALATTEEATTRHMGWQRGDVLWGLIVGADHHRFVGHDTKIEFRPPIGFEQFAAGWSKSGRWEKWLQAMEPAILEWPLVMCGIYASAATPLLTILNVPPFVFEWCGKTSTGKTTALRAAASVWGKPEVGAGIISTWSQTAVYRERLAGVCHSLPVMLDETKIANPKEIAPILYQFAGGQGKGRGNIEGVRETSGWQTIMLTTGEGPITGYSRDDGTRARVISVFGSPMPTKSSPEDMLAVNMFMEGFASNYGHLGERMCRYLTRSQASHGMLRESYREMVDYYAKGQNEVARRLARPLALLHMTMNIVHDPKGCDMEHPRYNPMEALIDGVQSNAADSDQAAMAADDVNAWMQANRHAFLGGANKMPPPGGWLGLWDPEREYIAVRREPLAAYLERQHYDVNAIFRQWRESRRIIADRESVAKVTTYHMADGNVWRSRAIHFVPPVYADLPAPPAVPVEPPQVVNDPAECPY